MSPSNPQRPRLTQGQRRAEAERGLLEAATRSFARKGVDGSSLADIGAEAGFSRALVNHHFGSRAALIERLAAKSQRMFLTTLGPAKVDGEDQYTVSRLEHVADSYLALVESNLERYRAHLVMWGSAFPEEAPLRDVFAEGDERFRVSVSSYIRQGQAAGTMRAGVDADAFATVFVAMMRGVTSQVVIAPDAVDLVSTRATCLELIRSHLTPLEGQ